MWSYHPPTKLRKLSDSIDSRVGELVIVIGVYFLVDAHQHVGSMSKDSHYMVAKENCGGVS
jgi:hypothetical protein